MMKFKQYHKHNVEVNWKMVEDYYTFIFEDIDTTYCGKVEKHWTTKAGNELFAVRDSDCYVTISEFSGGYLHGIGNCGVDYCIATEDIPNLVKKLEAKYNENFEYPE